MRNISKTITMFHIICLALVLTYPQRVAADNFIAESDIENQIRKTVKLDPILFTLQKRGSGSGLVTIQIVLEVLNDEDYEDILLRKPQLMADFTAALVAMSRKAFSIDRPIDPSLISMALMPFADRRLGKEKINIYITKALIVAN